MIGPPVNACFDLSSRVKSPEIAVQCAPASFERNSTLPPIYTSFESFGEIAIGDVQLKRYFSFDISRSPGPRLYGRTAALASFSRFVRTIAPGTALLVGHHKPVARRLEGRRAGVVKALPDFLLPQMVETFI